MMNHKIMLTLTGSLEHGLQVFIDTPRQSASGNLPERPTLKYLYQELQNSLHHFYQASQSANSWRGDSDLEFDESLPTSRQESQNRQALLQQCQALQKQIETEMRAWLRNTTPAWVDIRGILQTDINLCQDFIIKADEQFLYKLPWHTWDLVENHRNIEITFAPINYTNTLKSEPVEIKDKPKVLAVMGSDAEINYSADIEELQNLHCQNSIQLSLLNKPKIKDFFRQIRDDAGWDFLIFSGHSTTEAQAGRIYLDESQSITVEEFKNSVREAAANGLQLALFNSCQGLGIAQNLVDLQVPIIIIMREPVGDRIAQQFLRDFLHFYTNGATLAVSVRRARERLEDYEPNDWPSSTWLPMIYRNPQIDLPLWQDFYSKVKSSQVSLIKASVVMLLVPLIILGIRQFGWLQNLELQAYDWALTSRIDFNSTYKDNRILVVEIRDRDIQYQREKNMEFKDRANSLSEEALEKTIDYLQQNQAKLIGLDIYRDFPASNDSLKIKLENANNLYSICQTTTKDKEGIQAPPEAAEGRITFSDVPKDKKDDIVRRHLLTIDDQEFDPSCPTHRSFSIALASEYLSQENIQFETLSREEEKYRFGSVMFDFPEMLITAYQDNYYSSGGQLMLNYSLYKKSLTDIVESVTLEDILENRVDRQFIKDRIVLIGVATSSSKDYWRTPYSIRGQRVKIPGVFLHAQMISQILRAVLDNRPLIRPLPKYLETIWFLAFSGIGTFLGICATHLYRFRNIAILVAILGLVKIHVLLFGFGIWTPIIPSFLGLTVAFILVVLYNKYGKKYQ